MERVSGFDLTLKGVGLFGGKDPHSLWIGVAQSESLTQLAAGCEKAARRVKLKPEPHKFTPHVTVAYLNNAALYRVQRFEQELALFATKVDVAEELSRLDMHIAEVRRVLTAGGSVGKRLDFLMQELHREANTLGSKSVDAELSQASLEMKVLIEQMRDQVQNLE